MTTPQTTRAVAYWRMSSNQQERSIPQQRAEMLPRCVPVGVQIVREFQDEGISGGGMAKRDAFLDMLRFCQECDKAGEPVEAVVCYDTARFSRADSNETAAYIWQFRQAGVNRLMTVERWYDFRREEDRAIFNLQQDFTNNRYLREHAQRVTRGKKENAGAGFANGGLPYGFDRLLVDGTGAAQGVYRRLQSFVKPKGWKVVPVPIRPDDPNPERQVERQTVEFIFHTYATQDISRWAIADALNERGVPGPGSRPGRPTCWGSEAVGDILTNPLYAGDYRWGVTVAGKYYRLIGGVVTPAPARPKRELSADGGIFRPDAYRAYWPEPFIDREIWDAVQRKLSTVRTHRGPRRDSFPLSGLLYCGRCGGRMGGATSTTVSGKGKRYTYRKYVCNTARGHGRHACGNQSVREDKLLPFLLDRLREVYLDPGRIEGLRQQLTENLAGGQRAAPERCAALRQGITEADAEILQGRRNLFRAKDDATFVQLNEELSAAMAQRDRLAKELECLERGQGGAADDLAAEVDRAIARLFDLRKKLEQAVPERLRAVLKQLMVRVDLYFREPEQPRQWSRFTRGVVKLRPLISFAVSKRAQESAAANE